MSDHPAQLDFPLHPLAYRWTFPAGLSQPAIFAQLDRCASCHRLCQLPPLPSRHRCASCHRVDIPEHRLSLRTTGVCRLCYLSAEVRELATNGGVSYALLVEVEEQLHQLYALLRAEVEVRDGGS